MKKYTLAHLLAGVGFLLCACAGIYMVLTAAAGMAELPEFSWADALAQTPALGYVLGLIAMLLGLISVTLGIALYVWMMRLIDKAAEREATGLAARKGGR